MAVTFTPIGAADASSGSVVNLTGITLTAGRPVLVWITSVNTGFLVYGVTADVAGTPQFFSQVPDSALVADGVSGDVTGVLWYLDAPISGTFDIQVVTNNISARRQAQVIEVRGHDTSAPDAWRSGFDAQQANILASVHQLAIATTSNDNAIVFIGLRQNSSAPNLSLNAGSTLVTNRLSGTTLRGVIASGTDAASAVVGGTTAVDTQSVLFGLQVRPYSSALLIASPRAITLGAPSVGLFTGVAGAHVLVVDSRAIVLTAPDVALTKTSAGALPAITLGTFPTAVQRLFLRAVAIEVNSAAALNPSSGWTALPGAESRANALAMIVRGEFKVSTATEETSEPTIAAFGDNASVMRALVSLPDFALTADVRALILAGVAVGLRAARRMSANPLSIAATFPDAALSRTRVLQAVARAFTLTGNPATLTAATVNTLVASTRAIVLTAPDVALLAPKAIAATPASLALTAPAAGLVVARTMPASGAALALVAYPVGLSRGRSMQAVARAFALLGVDVAFITSSLGTPLLWAIRGRIRPVVGESINPSGLAPTLAPRRARAPSGSSALLEFEVMDENGANVAGAAGALTIIDEDEGGAVAIGLPIEYDANAADSFAYRCITPVDTFDAETRYRGDITMTQGGQDAHGVMFLYAMENDVLTD